MNASSHWSEAPPDPTAERCRDCGKELDPIVGCYPCDPEVRAVRLLVRVGDAELWDPLFVDPEATFRFVRNGWAVLDPGSPTPPRYLKDHDAITSTDRAEARAVPDLR
jgi:hypothetical protein